MDNHSAPRLWRDGDFLKLWTGQTISALGSQVTLLGVPLAAVVVLHATPAAMGLLGAVESAPYFLVGLFAGAWIDQRQRRPLLIGSDLGRAVVLATIPAATVAHHLTLGHLYVVGFLVGGLTVVSDLADQAFLVTVVGRARLVDAASKQELSTSAMAVIGPGLAGALVQLLSAPMTLLLDALSYLLSALCVHRIHIKEALPTAQRPRETLWRQIGAGLHFVLGHRLLRPIVLSGAVLNFFSSVFVAVYLLFLVKELHFSPLLVGLLGALRSGGFLLGALLTPWAVRHVGAGPTLLAGVLLMGAVWGPFPFVHGSVLSVLPLLAAEHLANGLGNPMANITISSLRQRVTPDHLLGRMTASYRFLGRSAMPLGSLCGGALGTLLGLRPTLAVAAAGLVLGALWILPSPVPWLRTFPEAPEEACSPRTDGAPGA